MRSASRTSTAPLAATAREACSETSTNPSDHLTLGRFYMSSGQGDAPAESEEFRRAGGAGSWSSGRVVNLLFNTLSKPSTSMRPGSVAVEKFPARRSCPPIGAKLTLAYECCLVVGELSVQAESG